MYIEFRSVDIGPRPLKLSLNCEIAKKGGFGSLICRGRESPDFGHAFSKLHLFSTMWPDMV